MSGDDGFARELSAALPGLHAHVRRKVRHHSVAEDLIQDTLVAALRNAEDYVPGTNIQAWLAVIYRRVAGNYWRREATRTEYARTARPEEAVPPDQIDRVTLLDAGELMESLPADQNEALFLIVWEQKSYAEAAGILGCSIGTVKSRVSRARAAIARGLGMGHEEDEGREGPGYGQGM